MRPPTKLALGLSFRQKEALTLALKDMTENSILVFLFDHGGSL
jgi:hypothetical protein